MFTHLSLKHYKSVSSAEIDLHDLSVFVGSNASGKSNVIDSIRFLHDAITNNLDTALSSRHGFASIRERTPQRPYDVRIGFKFKNNSVHGSYEAVLTTVTGGAAAVKSEEASWHGEIMMPVRADKNSFRFAKQSAHVSYKRKPDGGVTLSIQAIGGVPIISKGKADPAELLLRNLQSFRPTDAQIHENLGGIPISTFLADPINAQVRSYEHYSIFPNDIRQPQKPVSEKRLSSSADNLTAVLKDMSSGQERRAKQEILSAIRRVEPDLVNIDVKSAAGYIFPVFDFKDSKGRKYTFNVAQISDGTLRLLGLLTALYQPAAPDCLSIEEPEQNINPGAMAVFADAVKDVAKRKQIFLTSHSPDFLDQFSPKNIVVVERVGSRTECGNMKPYQRKLVREGLFRVGELMKTEGLRRE